MQVFGQLGSASLENLSTDPTTVVQGRIYLNTAKTQAILDDGTNKRALLRNDQFLVIGNSATAANNIRLQRGGNGILQFVTGSDTTAEGTLSTSLASVQANLTNTTADIITYTDQTVTPATPAAGVTKFYTKAGLPYKLGSDGFETAVGSGQGTGTFNYLANGDFENGIGTASLATATITNSLPSGAVTAGAANLSLSLETSAPLQYLRSLRVTAASSWPAGQGVALGPAFTIQPNHRGKVLTAKVDYSVVTGASLLNFSGVIGSQNLSLAVYDVTAGAFLPSPAGALGFNTITGAQTVSCTFQTSTVAGQQYQFYALNLIAVTGNVAVLFDAASVSPQVVVNGAAMSDLISAGVNVITATTTAPVKGTVANDLVRYRRVGDHAHIKGEYKQTAAGSGTTGTGDYLFQLPTGLSFDSNKCTYYTTVIGGSATWLSQVGLGSAALSGGGSTNHAGTIIPYDATHFRIASINNVSTGSSAGTTGVVSASYCALNQASVTIAYDFMAPIAGWSSNVQLSSDTLTQVVAAQYKTITTTTASNGATLAFSTLVYDNTGSIQTSPFAFKAPVTGFYKISLTGLYTTGSAIDVGIFVNGTSRVDRAFGIGGPRCSGTAEVFVSSGDLISLLFQNNGTLGDALGFVFFERLSGPSVIAATESVNARYQGIVQNITSTAAILTPGAKLYDTHGAVGANGFVVPISGKYRAGGSTITQNTTYSISQKIELSLWKNGVFYSNLNRVFGNGTNSVAWQVSGSDSVQCVAGDVLALYAVSDVSTATYSPVQTPYMYMFFERIGN